MLVMGLRDASAKKGYSVLLDQFFTVSVSFVQVLSFEVFLVAFLRKVVKWHLACERSEIQTNYIRNNLTQGSFSREDLTISILLRR